MRFPSFVRAAVCALALVLSAGVFAQGMGGGSSQRGTEGQVGQGTGKKDDKGENKYPNATRKEPKLDMSASDQKDLNKAADLINDNKNDEAEPIVQKVMSNDKASKYAQAFAHTLQAQIYYEKDKSADAIAEYKKAIDMDALPNDAHFQTLYQIAQLQIAGREICRCAGDARPVGEAVRRADRRRARAESECVLPHRQVPGRGRYDEESAVDDGQAERQLDADPDGELFRAQSVRSGCRRSCSSRWPKNPTDKKLLNQLATIYIQADKPQQALDLMAKAKSQGLITTSEDYMQLAKLQAAADKYKDASATIKEGLDKDILKPSFDVYKLQGDVCTQGEDDACAIDAYTKASPQAKDGNIDYQLGYLLFYSDRSKDAAEALSRAISKGGLKQEGEAYLLRGDAENDSNQAPAATGGLAESVGLSEHQDDGRAAHQGGQGRRQDQARGEKTERLTTQHIATKSEVRITRARLCEAL